MPEEKYGRTYTIEPSTMNIFTTEADGHIYDCNDDAPLNHREVVEKNGVKTIFLCDDEYC